VRNDRATGVNPVTDGTVAGPQELVAAVSAFDKRRHERARAVLLHDSAADFGRASTTAGVIEYRTCEYREACRRFEHAEDARVTSDTAPGVVRALERLTDVEERHLVLTSTQEAAGTLPLAQQAAAHRRNLARGSPLTHDPLLSLSLVLLTHRLHVAGRGYDAVTFGQEAADIASRLVAAGRSDVRPTLVLTLDASLSIRFALGRHRDVVARLRRATGVLQALAAEDPVYHCDLTKHLLALDELGYEWDSRRSARRERPGGLTRRPPAREPCPSDVSEAGSAGRSDKFHRDADALYERGIRIVAGGADGPAAAAAAGAAVAAYRRLRVDPAKSGPRHVIDRKLARALWRHAIVLHELLDRPRDAVGPGRESVALGQQLLRATTSDAPWYGKVVGEVTTAMHDLCRIVEAAALVDEHARLTAQVQQLCAGRDRPTTREVGAALHHRAASAGEAAHALAARGRSPAAVVCAGIDASARAVMVRRGLVDGDEPVTRWELANSLLAHGHLRCLLGDAQVGALTIVEAYRTVASLPGPSAAAMRSAAREALLGVCSSHPELAIGDNWPL
jgi:hypothetical protein